MRYGVLGGGALGLTLALRLAERGHSVTLFEREPLPGGLAAGFQIPLAEGKSVWLEKFYHHVFRTDHAIIDLIEELDLGNLLEWRRPLTTTLIHGHAYQLDSALSVLTFPPIPLVDRLWMGAALAFLRFMPSSEPFEGKLAAAWARAAMGKTGYETVWGPLLKGKFGALADQIALPWLWARLHDRTAQLGYLHGGFQLLYNRLAERITSLGGSLSFGATVKRIERLEADDETDGGKVGQLRVTFDAVEQPGYTGHTPTATFDRVISTLPTHLTCRLTPQLPNDYRAQYEWGQAYGAHCLILALNRSLTGSYWMNIADPGYPFVALVEHTNYMPREDYGGRTLIYLGNYRPMTDPLFTASKEQVLSEFLPHLMRINPAFTPEWVTESWMFAAPFAQPIVTLDYREHIPPFETPILGLYVANMFQVYPHDRGQNYSIELAHRLIRLLE